MEQFNSEAGIQSVHVPYKSFQGVLPDIMSNTVQYGFMPVSSMQFVREGKLKALGFAGAQRDPQYPELSTLAEQGMKGFDASLHYYVIAPKGLPAEVVTKLNGAINAIQAKQSYQAKYTSMGGATVPQNVSPTAAKALLKLDDERFLPLVQEGKIRLE
jgi:tripartite-type tricarboxylate transporter receptor subunit TctC